MVIKRSNQRQAKEVGSSCSFLFLQLRAGKVKVLVLHLERSKDFYQRMRSCPGSLIGNMCT